ncbi:hypothetical protein GF382_02320 [Candidatus Falkowbacteria bacterium]|nr:hypothetical protein [Candidatus Falkowbacteria bacterium]
MNSEEYRSLLEELGKIAEDKGVEGLEIGLNTNLDRLCLDEAELIGTFDISDREILEEVRQAQTLKQVIKILEESRHAQVA